MNSLLQWLEVPLDSWLACAAVLLLGAFVQRATGFGLAVVGAPLLLMIEPRLVPVILVLFGFTVSLIMVRRYWHEVRLREIGVALIGRLPGNGLGIWLLLAAPMVVLEKLIAAIVLFVAGILSGVFGTVAAIGGPPIVLLMHGFSPDRMRGNLAAFFVLTSLLTLLTLALAGQISVWHFKLALTFLPAVLLGNALADTIAHRLDKQLLQRLSLGLCTLAALGLLL